MLRPPVIDDVFADPVRPVPAKATPTSLHRSFTVEPQKMFLIGSGAFGSVRVGWLQERRHYNRRVARAGGGGVESTIVLGTCAAVAVKRVAVPDVGSGSCGSRQQMLLRELRVMEQIRMYPHPNIVQCWGFLFGKAGGESPSTGCVSIDDGTDASSGGTVLTSLNREQQRMNISNDNTNGGNQAACRLFDGVSYVDLCLSLCTGGTLGEYVNQKAREVLSMATKSLDVRLTAQPVSGAMAPEKGALEHITDKKELSENTAEGVSSCSCDGSSERHTHITERSFEQSERLLGLSKKQSFFIEPQLAIRERDIVSILYALVSALRHTHDVLQTLHRDIKPANVLICSGVGKTPQYVLQPSLTQPEAVSRGEMWRNRNMAFSSNATPVSIFEGNRTRVGTAPDSGSSVELALFSEPPPTTDRSTATQRSSSDGKSSKEEKIEEESFATLVVPLGSDQSRLPSAAADPDQRVYIDYMPQIEAWRIQLADFGVSTGVGQLSGSGRCGTFPFMAPEVAGDCHRGAPKQYDTKADIYSLGVTLQHVLVHLFVGGEDGNQTTRRHLGALGAQWVDEDDTEEESKMAPDTEPEETELSPDVRQQFLVPKAWRCQRELGEKQYIDSAPRGCGRPEPGVVDGEEQGGEQKAFAVPRTWRCRDELLEHRYIRRERPSKKESDAYANLLAPLPEGVAGSKDGSASRERQRPRCRSCGRLHRHLIELLNAMTMPQPSQRPPLSIILQSAAIIDHGTFVDIRGPACCDDSDVAPAPPPPPGEGRTVDYFLRTRQQFRSRTRASAAPSAFRFDATTPKQQKGEDEKGTKEEEEDATVLLWRPPSLNFLRAPYNRTKKYGK